MKKPLSIILIILPIFLFGQETRKISQNHKNPEYKEVYYVLKSDKSVKQGSYQKFDSRKNLKINGFYKNGKRDSVWEFYDYSGKLEQKFNYTTRELIFNHDDLPKDNKYKVINGTDTIETTLDRPPVYIGGASSINEMISDSINYPEDAKENQITGTVYVVFTIDHDGTSGNFKAITGKEFDKDSIKMKSIKAEAIRVVKLIPSNWLPGILNGKSVKVVCVMPIRFMLE